MSSRNLWALIALVVAIVGVARCAQAANVTVAPNPAWAGDTTVKAACKLDAGPLVVLAVLPAVVTVPTPPPGDGLPKTAVVDCFAFRGTDPLAPTIRSVAVSDSQTFPGTLAPPSLSH